MKVYNNDTIAAISTAVGEGAIGIVRLSGERAVEIASKILRQNNKTSLSDRRSHSIFLASVVDPEDGSLVDEVLVSIMRAPNTYTREDIVEINCHGGAVALRKTLGLALAAGARIADPGEFTKRAFLNGRIDLTQAEAVIDAIRSRTDAALKAAINQLEGGLSRDIGDIAEDIANVLTQIEAAVDFSDEDIETLPKQHLIETLRGAVNKIDRLVRTAVRGRILKEGVKTAIIGRPNVGKSSLLNALLRRERAIVTPVPGTTRDIIEEMVNVRGIPLILTDTAGIRDSNDEVERIGIEFSRKAIKAADIIICVLDASQEICDEDLALISEIGRDTAVLVLNKTDLPQKISRENLQLPGNFKAVVKVSAISGAGVEALEEEIEKILLDGSVGIAGSTIITNARHEQLLEMALGHVREATALIEADQPEEIVSTVLKESLDCLAEITGEAIGDDILGRIFSQFCIGK
ncbi:MAG: tRNA uridine-5-carboxymethylaminomethyl(34) synthesis GTPase MnmE [Firmicutes bacterium]|nr:tRNA uridine-5-carboxymethylaminomethyl(34) synthesis GTPase MnmE [Bacillota bacterium]